MRCNSHCSISVIDMRTVAEKLSSFEPVTTDEITRLLSRSPAKHCLLDPVPTWLLKRSSDILAPVLSVMCNASMQSGKFPDTHKQATVFPKLKKPMLDADDANSYRPISNLSFVSKLVERAVATILVSMQKLINYFQIDSQHTVGITALKPLSLVS